MREIMFRAWDTHKEKMYSWADISNSEMYKLNDPVWKTKYEYLQEDIVNITDYPFDGSINVNGKYEVGYNKEMELCCGSWLLFRMKNYAEIYRNHLRKS